MKSRKLKTIVLATLIVLSTLIAFPLIHTVNAANYATTPINTLATVYGDSWSASDSSYAASHFNFLVTDFPDNAGNPTLVKTYNPSVTILGYKDLLGSIAGYPGWSTINANEAWFMHDIYGNRITFFYGYYYLMNPASGWTQYFSSQINGELSTYNAFNGVMFDDTWYQLSSHVSWGMLKDAATGATLTSSDMSSSDLNNWNSNMVWMLQYIKANLPAGKIIIPNSDEGFFGNHNYLDATDGTIMEGFMHAAYEDTSSHDYVWYGEFDNSLAYLQYGSSNGKIMLTESGCTTNDAATVQFAFAGFLLGMNDATSYWGWNTGGLYYLTGTNDYQPLTATNIGSPTGAYYQSQGVYMRDFTGGKVLVNPSSNYYYVYVGSGYTLDGSSVSSVTLSAYGSVILDSSSISYNPPPQPTQPPQSSSTTFGTTTIGSSSTTFYSGIPRATQYTPTSSGTVTDIMLYLTGSGHAQVAIYGDNGNAPGALLAKGSSDAITSNGWHDFSGFNVAVTGGTPYWLACESDSGSLLWYYNGGGANYCQGSGGSYGTFPSSFVRASTGNYMTSIYAVYDSTSSSQQSSQTGTFGTTTIGSSSTTFYSGIPRATQYTPTNSGTVTDIMLYLTVNGAGGHAQAAIYADSGNAPGALLAKSSSDTINTNGWHDFSGLNVAITAGTPYWLACETDSGNLLWYYNNGGANYYQGTGSSTYGTFPNPYVRGSTGNYMTSIYAIYTSTS